MDEPVSRAPNHVCKTFRANTRRTDSAGSIRIKPFSPPYLEPTVNKLRGNANFFSSFHSKKSLKCPLHFSETAPEIWQTCFINPYRSHRRLFFSPPPTGVLDASRPKYPNKCKNGHIWRKIDFKVNVVLNIWQRVGSGL